MDEGKMLVVVREFCTGCRLCEKSCPAGAIKVTGGKAKINNILCNNCNRCVLVCPNAAIKHKVAPAKKTSISNQEKLKKLWQQLNDLRIELNRFEAELEKMGTKMNKGKGKADSYRYKGGYKNAMDRQ